MRLRDVIFVTIRYLLRDLELLVALFTKQSLHQKTSFFAGLRYDYDIIK